MQFIVDFQVCQLVVGGIVDDFCFDSWQGVGVDCVFQCVWCEYIGVYFVDFVWFDCFGVKIVDCVINQCVVQVGDIQFGVVIVQQFYQFYVDVVQVLYCDVGFVYFFMVEFEVYCCYQCLQCFVGGEWGWIVGVVMDLVYVGYELVFQVDVFYVVDVGIDVFGGDVVFFQ